MSERVYFTWPDGQLSYECHACGACCRGLGIGFDGVAGELSRLACEEPALACFVRRRGEASTAANPRGRCWFMQPDGLCRIEASRGRGRKPASCRLFPFNRLFRAGEWLVVDYNSIICPLVAGRGALSGVRHEDVLREVKAVADPAMVGSVPFPGASRLLDGEALLAARCFAAADAGWEAVLGAQISGDWRSFLAPVEAGVLAVLGQRWDPPEPEAMRQAALLTPSLRFNELFGPRTWVRSSPSPSSALLGMWLGWLHLLSQGERLAKRPLSLQDATSVWSEAASFVWLLAHWDRAPVMPAGQLAYSGPRAHRDDVVRFAERCYGNVTQRLPLSEVAAPLVADRPVHEKVELLRLLEPLLERIRFREAEAR